MQQGVSFADVRALLNAYPQGGAERDEVCASARLRVRVPPFSSGPPEYMIASYCAFTRRIVTTTSHILQDGRLPYDLALEFGGSAKLLGLLQPGSDAWSEGYQQADDPLVSAAESRVFESLSRLLDPNPRRLKRIISVYALATEVAKRMPLSEGDSKARYAI